MRTIASSGAILKKLQSYQYSQLYGRCGWNYIVYVTFMGGCGREWWISWTEKRPRGVLLTFWWSDERVRYACLLASNHSSLMDGLVEVRYWDLKLVSYQTFLLFFCQFYSTPFFLLLSFFFVKRAISTEKNIKIYTTFSETYANR